MSRTQPSDTFKALYFDIIDPLFKQICDNDNNYCIKSQVNDLPVPFAINAKYEDYKAEALEHMAGSRLDRHKLASCICGAIVEIQPLTGYNNAPISKTANETFALYVGLYVVEYYMIYDCLLKPEVPDQEKEGLIKYLKENFLMQFPDNICDAQKYDKNLANALYWSRQSRGDLGNRCSRFDTWAYAKIFYHLELHNRPYMEQVITAFLKK